MIDRADVVCTAKILPNGLKNYMWKLEKGK
jgi:hypothetical protein